VNRRRRVVITGLGVVAPNGIGKDAFWQSLVAGKSAVDRITAFDARRYSSQVAAEVRTFHALDYMPARIARSVGRFTQFAVAASTLAVRDSDLPDNLGTSEPSTALCFGTSAGGSADIGEANIRNFLSEVSPSLDPLAMLEVSPHAATSHVSQQFKLTGPTTTISSGCTTGLDVIEWSRSQIASGRSDIAIAGAAETPLSPFVFALFTVGGFLSTWQGSPSAASRPYDLLRSGLVLSEAAGAVVLEDLDHAIDRGATIYAEVAGYGCASEGGLAGDRRARYCQGLASALRAACRDAGTSHVDYINAHGNSTQDDDVADSRAYKDVFGVPHVFSIPISSIKAVTGQPLAAAGLLQAISTALSIREDLLPPTTNLQYPDPECDLDYVPNQARRVRIKNALIHAHSLGGRVPGTHAALLLSSLHRGL
jgi:3-oxoacyl-[acyl-carrier-protein] synthase II